MPNFDKTGPQGQGKMTGRGLGPCGQGKGFGMGRGMGFGGRCRGYGRGLGRYFGWNAPQTTEEKTEDLKAYKQSLQEELEDVEKELSSMQ
jgi:hypothetical protein